MTEKEKMLCGEIYNANYAKSCWQSAQYAKNSATTTTITGRGVERNYAQALGYLQE